MPAVDGSAQLRRIAAELRVNGNGALKVKMTRGLRVGAAPLKPAVRNAALRQLPRGGGLNAQVAGQRVTVSVLTGARTAGVRMRTTAPDTAMTDAGFVRHPIYGHRGKGQWRTQQIPQAAGWWSKTLANGAPLVAPALIAVMRETGAEIVNG